MDTGSLKCGMPVFVATAGKSPGLLGRRPHADRQDGGSEREGGMRRDDGVKRSMEAYWMRSGGDHVGLRGAGKRSLRGHEWRRFAGLRGGADAGFVSQPRADFMRSRSLQGT